MGKVNLPNAIITFVTFFTLGLAPRADLDMSTVIRWRLLCLHKDISVIILHSIAVL